MSHDSRRIAHGALVAIVALTVLATWNLSAFVSTEPAPTDGADALPLGLATLTKGGQFEACEYCADAWCNQQPGEPECPDGSSSGYFHAFTSNQESCPSEFEEEPFSQCYVEDFQRETPHGYPAANHCLASPHEECPFEHVPADAIAAAVERRDSAHLLTWISRPEVDLNTDTAAIQVKDCGGGVITHIPVDGSLLDDLISGGRLQDHSASRGL